MPSTSSRIKRESLIGYPEREPEADKDQLWRFVFKGTDAAIWVKIMLYPISHDFADNLRQLESDSRLGDCRFGSNGGGFVARLAPASSCLYVLHKSLGASHVQSLVGYILSGPLLSA